MARSLFWLSDEAWKTLEPHLPHGKPGKPRVDDRTVISGILHVLKTGCRWRDVPPAYGPPTTIYNRYNRWSQRRIWQRIFEKMAAAGPVPDELSIDSSHVKAHRSAAGSKRGSSRKRLAVRAAEERAKSMLWPQMAQTKEGQSRRSIHSLTPVALSSGQQGLQTQKSRTGDASQPDMTAMRKTISPVSPSQP